MADIKHGLRMTKNEDIKRYIFGGRGLFILKSNKSQKSYEYKISHIKGDTENLAIKVNRVIGGGFIGLLNMEKSQFIHTKNSRLPINHESVRGIDWLVKNVNQDGYLTDMMEFYHMGICCCCGRTLTVRDNVELGIGPICLKNYGKKTKRISRILKIREIRKKINGLN